MSRNERRIKHYHALRSCGFTSELATKFKDNSPEKIEELCKIIQEAKQSHDEIDKKVFQRFNEIMKRA